MDLNTISTIVSLVILGATYLILQPLKASIVGLQASVDKLAAAQKLSGNYGTGLQWHTTS